MATTESAIQLAGAFVGGGLALGGGAIGGAVCYPRSIWRWTPRIGRPVWWSSLCGAATGSWRQRWRSFFEVVSWAMAGPCACPCRDCDL